MISEEEKERYIEASKCKDCSSWLHHCKAECCKIIFLNINPKELERGGKYFITKPREVLGLSDREYYRLHGVECVRDLLRFRKERIEVIGNKVMYIHPCEFLTEENLCKGHPDKKPELCKFLTLETAKLPGQPFELTSNCLFKYKSREVKKHD